MHIKINGDKYELGTSASVNTCRNELIIRSLSAHRLVSVNVHNAAAAALLRDLTEESFLDGEDVNITIVDPGRGTKR